LFVWATPPNLKHPTRPTEHLPQNNGHLQRLLVTLHSQFQLRSCGTFKASIVRIARISSPVGDIAVPDFQQHVAIPDSGLEGRASVQHVRYEIIALVVTRHKDGTETVVFDRSRGRLFGPKIGNAMFAIHDQVEAL
jgi:hypothetical protein